MRDRILKRGKPDYGSPVHMHLSQNRPGLREGWDFNADYMATAMCRPGSFHIFMVWDDIDPETGQYAHADLVTCPACLAKMRGEE